MCEYAGGKPVCAMKVKVSCLFGFNLAEVGGRAFVVCLHYPPIMIL